MNTLLVLPQRIYPGLREGFFFFAKIPMGCEAMIADRLCTMILQPKYYRSEAAQH